MKMIDVKKRCGVCEKESTQQMILSRSRFGGTTHLDGRNDEGFVDVPLEICPHCHYTNFNIDGKIKLSVSDIDNKLDELKEFKEYSQKYILAGWANENVGNKKEAGFAYLYASWTLEDEKDLKNADIYRCKACDMLLEQALREEDGDKIMQCVDLYRKNGNFREAYNLLDTLHNSLKEEGEINEEFKNDDQYKMIEKFIQYERTRCSLEDKQDHLMEEIYNKMNFIDFYCLFLRRSKFDNFECSMYAPIIYDMKEVYFNAAVECLNTGRCEELSFGNISTKEIINGYRLQADEKSYLKALIVLSNLENNNQNAYLIFNPYTIE